MMGCVGLKKIEPDGLSYLTIGEAMPEPGIRRLKGLSVRDTLYEADGFQWRASILRYPHGKVYVEEDFFGNGTVNRIRIESPDLKFKRQFSVGMEVVQLQKLASSWNIYYLDDYQLLDVSASNYPEIHFLVQDQALLQRRPEEDTLSLEDLNPQARVRAIVVM